MQKLEESGQFQNFCRMSPEDFDHLLSLTSDKIRKSSTNFRDSIPAYDKLAVTLRFLATGDAYESLMYFTKMSKSTTCNAISEALATRGSSCLDFFGGIVVWPDRSNVEGCHCGVVFLNPTEAAGRQQNVPFVFVANDAFPLQRHIMKPYPGTHAREFEKQIYNYRLSRARRIVENAFGILSAVFRVLRKPLLLQPDKASLIVMTCVYLHNYLMKRKASRKLYNSPGMMDRIEDVVVIPGQWRNMDRLSSFLPLPNTGQRHTLQCENIRKEFSD
ncbi:hypothetical protein EVAR_62404_1 [Eumeta japonica]|uniref:DDE Tnp4 domain-containing protein n=1 Tax=Eumeta variegata TaxID=151549 RepID=A0A4C1Z9H7_EUMVA|nr:hypothetical protein EVAR_62404_1 [Eumeta japonica]